jgi:hypothetical protein
MGASVLICIVKMTYSGKTFTKKLLSGLVGATDTLKEPSEFTVKFRSHVTPMNACNYTNGMELEMSFGIPSQRWA